MARIRVMVCVCAVLMAMLLSSTPLRAQLAGTGFVGGTVTDPSGAAIAGATVTLKDLATSAERTATTNESGRYSFSAVTPGKYDVTISRSGFRQVKFSAQEVVVAESRTFDAKLEIGSPTETVEVVASNTELQTMNATIGATVTGVPLDSLPSLGRDVSSFATLQPGVSPDGSVGGANQDQNSFFLDGGNNSSDMDGTQNTYTPSFAGDPTGGLVNNQVTGTAPGGASGGGGPTGVMPTPADSVEEFRVVTSNQTADFNSSAGAQVQLVTKRGGQQWHGTGYEYYLNNNWNANSFDNNATGTPIPVYHYNRFGGSIGGPVIPKEILGGKTYFFANYEGFRWGNSATVTRAVPSDGMKLGLLQFDGTVYNLNPGPTTYPSSAPALGALTPGTTYAGSGTTLDPRGLGISPTVQAVFQQYEPPSNISSCGGVSRCDGLNVLSFRANYALPWKDNFGVARLDHDFGSRWHFYATYRYYKMERATSNQVDIGGFLPGDKLGMPVSTANRPQNPWFLAAALNTNITPTLTNDFHYSYLRNYWARASAAQPPQIAGLGGALEPFGESSKNVLAPLNLDTQDVRTRFWDGQDHMIRDDVSWAKGTHFFQFGGLYQHNWNYHQRTDNGGGINYQSVYWLGASVGSTNGMDMTGFTPSGISAGNASNWARDYAIVLGVPGVTQIAYTRTGSDLALNPPNTPAFDKSTIPFYNLYFNDSWRMKPTITLSYGLGWTLEMPPTEAEGKQIAVVDANNKIINTAQYLQNRENAALAGQPYNPEIGFTLIHNVAGNPKYLYNPYYKSFSPRIAVAWNPNYDSGLLGDLFGHGGKTVVRGGFSILYGRLNGVDLVLVPLLGTGLIQAVQCVSPLQNGTCGGPGGATPNTAFRIGPTANNFNGLVAPLPAASPTLSQPDYPGINEIAAGAGEGIDPNFRPSMSKQFDLTVQRQFTSKLSVEFGYMGRLLTHEFQPLNMNAVPYMMTVGGQRFDNAYGQMVMQYCGGAQGLAGGGCKGNLGAVTPQPFFENALNAAYCAGFASCTAAVAAKEGNAGGKVTQSNIAQDNVWSLWSDLDNGAFKFARTMLNTPINCPTGTEIGCNGQLSSGIGMNTSFGWGNYNGAFISVKMNNWHGITLQSNFTYSKALGTGSQVQATSQYTISDPYYLGRNYGLQPWDRKYLFNTWIVYQPPFYQSQQGVLGHLLGGWTFAPIIDIGSGIPMGVFPADAFANELYGGGQAFGEADAANFGAEQNAINMCSNSSFGSSRHNNPAGSSAFGSSWYGPSIFANPEQAYACFRNPILGIDNGHNGAAGQLRGMPFWNVDFSLRKNLKLTERFSTEFSAVFTNIFNHNQMSDSLNIIGDVGDWGGLGGSTGVGQVNNPRAMEFGLRVRF